MSERTDQTGAGNPVTDPLGDAITVLENVRIEMPSARRDTEDAQNRVNLALEYLRMLEREPAAQSDPKPKEPLKAIRDLLRADIEPSHSGDAQGGVYVDDARILWRGKRWSHLYAESLAELLAFGDRIGLKRSWLQHPTGEDGLPHYDVTGKMRDRAIAEGATLVSGGDGTYRRLRRALSSGEYPLSALLPSGEKKPQ